MKRTAALLACAALATAALAEDSAKDTFKKAEKGAGQLFQGIGQEIKKAEDSLKKSGKKDDKPKDKDAAKK